MNLTFSQARKRREQSVVRFCEAMNIIGMGVAFTLAISLIVHNMFLS